MPPVPAALDFCQKHSVVPGQSSSNWVSPMSSSRLWRFLAFPLLFLIGSTATNSMTVFVQTLSCLEFVSSLTTLLWSPDGPSRWPSRFHCTNPAWIILPPPKPTPFDTQYLILYKEVTSSICTSVAILTTLIRLFVRRPVFWLDDVSRFPWPKPTHLENLLVDWPMNIGKRSVEHVIRNCSYGNHR